MLEPFSHHPHYTETFQRWELPRDLLGRLPAMVSRQDIGGQRRIKWLPPHPFEDLSPSGAYQRRVERTTLFGAFADTVDRIASKPFRRGVQVQGLPPDLEVLLEDADGESTSLHALGRQHFARKVAFGVSHLLVDWPNTSDQQDADGNVPIAVRNRLRPYLCLVSPLHTTNWQRETAEVSGDLVEVHIREDRYEEVAGEVVLVERERIIMPDRVVIFRRNGENEAAQLEAEYGNPLGMVPVITDSVGSPDTEDVTDPMVSWPPLEDLAWLNLAHFQSGSMQRMALDKLRAITAYETGVPNAEVKTPLTLGGAIRRASKDSRLEFPEPTGSGVEHGWRDLDKLEEQMEKLGSQPLARRSGTATATGRAMDEAKTEAAAETWARATEGALKRALGLAWRWTQPNPAAADPDTGLPDLSVDIATEFATLQGGMEEVGILKELAFEGKLPDRVLFEELKARGILRESVDVEALAEEASQSTMDRLRAMPTLTPEPAGREQDGGEPPTPEDA